MRLQNMQRFCSKSKMKCVSSKISTAQEYSSYESARLIVTKWYAMFLLQVWISTGVSSRFLVRSFITMLSRPQNWEIQIFLMTSPIHLSVSLSTSVVVAGKIKSFSNESVWTNKYSPSSWRPSTRKRQNYSKVTYWRDSIQSGLFIPFQIAH